MRKMKREKRPEISDKEIEEIGLNYFKDLAFNRHTIEEEALECEKVKARKLLKNSNIINTETEIFRTITNFQKA